VDRQDCSIPKVIWMNKTKAPPQMAVGELSPETYFNKIQKKIAVTKPLTRAARSIVDRKTAD